MVAGGCGVAVAALGGVSAETKSLLHLEHAICMRALSMPACATSGARMLGKVFDVDCGDRYAKRYRMGGNQLVDVVFFSLRGQRFRVRLATDASSNTLGVAVERGGLAKLRGRLGMK